MDKASTVNVDGHVYVVETKQFVDVETLRRYDKDQFDALFAADLEELSAARQFLTRGGRIIERWTYRPGAERFVDEDGCSALNLYRPPALNPQLDHPGPWLDLGSRLFPDREVLDHVLNWCALLVGWPEVKVNHGLLITGAQGIGKDSFFRPVIDAVGPWNVNHIGPHDLETVFTDWLSAKKLIVVEEIRAFHDRALANRLKPYLAAPPESIRINAKFTPQYTIPNVAAFLFFSNVDDPIAIAEDDRRLFVYRSPAQRQPDAYFGTYHHWCNDHAPDVLGYLLGRDIRGFNPKARPPVTADKAELIEASRSPLVQWLRSALDAREYPLAGDLVRLHDLAAHLPAQLGKPSEHRIGRALRSLGGVELGQIRMPGDGKPRLWAVRRGPFYQAQSESQLASLYLQQQATRPGAFRPVRGAL